MKKLYSMILLMSAMSVCGPEKALTTKLRNDYDLQLAQKQKERESRKLLQSVAKEPKKINVRDGQQKNIKKDKSCKIKQEYNGYIKEKKLSNCARCALLGAFVVGWFSPIVAFRYDPRCASINWSAVIEY